MIKLLLAGFLASGNPYVPVVLNVQTFNGFFEVPKDKFWTVFIDGRHSERKPRSGLSWTSIRQFVVDQNHNLGNNSFIKWAAGIFFLKKNQLLIGRAATGENDHFRIVNSPFFGRSFGHYTKLMNGVHMRRSMEMFDIGMVGRHFSEISQLDITCNNKTSGVFAYKIENKSNFNPRAKAIMGDFVGSFHRFGGIASVFDGFASKNNLPQQKTGGDTGYKQANSSEQEQPKGPSGHGFLSRQIAISAFGVAFGLGIIGYSLRKIRQASPVSWWTLFYIFLILSGGALAGFSIIIVLISTI